jgi:hypothetical protein
VSGSSFARIAYSGASRGDSGSGLPFTAVIHPSATANLAPNWRRDLDYRPTFRKR